MLERRVLTARVSDSWVMLLTLWGAGLDNSVPSRSLALKADLKIQWATDERLQIAKALIDISYQG